MKKTQEPDETTKDTKEFGAAHDEVKEILERQVQKQRELRKALKIYKGKLVGKGRDNVVDVMENEQDKTLVLTMQPMAPEGAREAMERQEELTRDQDSLSCP
jgi:hypothetical protein